MNQDQVNKDLLEKDTSEFQQSVLTFIRPRLTSACTSMGNVHSSWEEQDRIYRGYRVLDKQDEKSKGVGSPPKIIIPVGYALTQTALSFLMSTFFNDERMYRFMGNDPKSQRFKEGLELDIHWQLGRMKAYYVFHQWLQDAFKYGVGVVRTSWEEEYKKYRVRRAVPQAGGFVQMIASLFGGNQQEAPMVMQEMVEDIKCFEGSRVINVSPYSFYPDPSVTVSNFRKGSFVAYEEETTKAGLAGLNGYTLFGVDKIPNTMPADLFNARTRRVGKYNVFATSDFRNAVQSASGQMSMEGTVIKTEFEFTTTKKELKRLFDYDLGPEWSGDTPLKMLAVAANDQKLLKFEPLGYLHGEYSYDVIEYSPDHNAFLNPGLGETVHEMQSMMTWFINSHVQNVRKAIRNRFIGDPSKIHTEDLTAGLEFIRVKDMMGKSVSDVIKSLEVVDVTQRHTADAQLFMTLIQLVTGINDNALGQYHTGRRSATESQNVTNSATSRLKMHGMLAWSQGFEPLGQKLVANTNQLRSEEFYSRIIGEDIVKYPYDQTILVEPETIIGGFQFVPYEGTMPNDKSRSAAFFTRLLEAAMGNPAEFRQATGVNIGKILDHVFSLYGIKNFQDFVENPNILGAPLPVEVVPQGQELPMGAEQVPMPDDLINALAGGQQGGY